MITHLNSTDILSLHSIRWFVLFLKIYLFITCKILCSCRQTSIQMASDLITDGCELPCGCWNLNSGPLEEQSGRQFRCQLFLIAEPSPQCKVEFIVLRIKCEVLFHFLMFHCYKGLSKRMSINEVPVSVFLKQGQCYQSWLQL